MWGSLRRNAPGRRLGCVAYVCVSWGLSRLLRRDHSSARARPRPLPLSSLRPATPTQGGTVDPHAFGNREPIYGENGKSSSYERTWWPRSQRLFLIFIALVKK
jgi:hypothetical protein